MLFAVELSHLTVLSVRCGASFLCQFAVWQLSAAQQQRMHGAGSGITELC